MMYVLHVCAVLAATKSLSASALFVTAPLGFAEFAGVGSVRACGKRDTPAPAHVFFAFLSAVQSVPHVRWWFPARDLNEW